MQDEVKYPWIVVHQPDGPGGKIVTYLSGYPGAGYREFSLVVADVIRHVAQAYGVSEADVMDVVQREIDDPTTSIEGHRVS